MSGSNISFNIPVDGGNRHVDLKGRGELLQHPLEAIYRQSDGANLATILNSMTERDTSFKFEVFEITSETDTLTLTKFSYNMVKDELWVNISGVDVFEGTDKDYVKISGTEVKFNYTLKVGYEVCIVLAGTRSSVSYGDDIFNALNKFTQLTDTPQSYHGKGGQYAKVNDEETGLVFGPAIANTSLTKLEYDFTSVSANTTLDKWLPFVNRGIIKGIKVTGDSNAENFSFSVWTKLGGYWVYYSGQVFNILWDIMDIPFVDESGTDSVYVRLNNQGPTTNFKIQIYIVL
jgi:hypothetical protein